MRMERRIPPVGLFQLTACPTAVHLHTGRTPGGTQLTVCRPLPHRKQSVWNPLPPTWYSQEVTWSLIVVPELNITLLYSFEYKYSCWGVSAWSLGIREELASHY